MPPVRAIVLPHDRPKRARGHAKALEHPLGSGYLVPKRALTLKHYEWEMVVGVVANGMPPGQDFPH